MKEKWISYKACYILPSLSTYKIESIMRLENLEEYLCNSIGLYYIIIDNITYNDKKIAILNTKLSDLLKNIQKVDFNQKLYEDTRQFLLESKKLSVFDENGLVWG
jgi:hypothetical protein